MSYVPTASFYPNTQAPQAQQQPQPTLAQRANATDHVTWLRLSPTQFLQMTLPDLQCPENAQGYQGRFSKSPIVEQVAVKMTATNFFDMEAEQGVLLVDQLISFIVRHYPNDVWQIYMQRYGGYTLREQQVTWHMDKTIYTPCEISFNKILGLGLAQNNKRPVFTLKFLPTPPCVLNDDKTKKSSYLEPDRVLVLCKNSYTKIDPSKKSFTRLPDSRLNGFPDPDAIFALAVVDSKFRKTLQPKPVGEQGYMSNTIKQTKIPHPEVYGATVQTSRLRGDPNQECFNQLRTYCALFQCEFGFATEMNWSMACRFTLTEKSKDNVHALPLEALVDAGIRGDGANRERKVKARWPRAENVQTAFSMIVLRAAWLLNLANL